MQIYAALSVSIIIREVPGCENQIHAVKLNSPALIRAPLEGCLEGSYPTFAEFKQVSYHIWLS